MIQPLAPGSADRTHRIARAVAGALHHPDMFELSFRHTQLQSSGGIASIKWDDALILRRSGFWNGSRPSCDADPMFFFA